MQGRIYIYTVDEKSMSLLLRVENVLCFLDVFVDTFE